MKRSSIKIRTLLLGAGIALAAGGPALTSAAPGTLSQGPLFLTSRVPANILFTLDDSGSMNWEILLSNEAQKAHPDNRNRDYLEFEKSEEEHQLELCHAYNVMAYNPNVRYTPWFGVDKKGDKYTNQKLTAARKNPYETSTDDISWHYFFKWNDKDGDGKYDKGECPTADWVEEADDCDDDNKNGCIVVAELPEAQQINYANWWSYYRKREYVMKRVMSELITNSDNRMGLATLHNHNDVSTPITDMQTVSNKIKLLNQLFQVKSSNGTPLRIALREAGEYFDDTDKKDHQYLKNEPNPILSQADGGACQQNFSILLSDGYWNGKDPGFGNEDGDGKSKWDGGSHADDYDETLADVAMHYYENDLSKLPDEVKPIAGVDENEEQHMVTFTVAFGINGTKNSNPPNREDAFDWPEAKKNSATSIDDMRHAAWNGRGNFLSAKDPRDLINSMNAAILNIQERTATSSSVAFNTSRLSTNSVIYQARFNSVRWSGELLAHPLDPVTGELSLTPDWAAATELNSKSPANRVIVTNDGTDGVPFAWGSLSSAQQADLKTNPDGTVSDDAKAQARLDYLRGDRSNEDSGYFFRSRSTRLGDIVHSAPIYVGVPGLNWPNNPDAGLGDLFGVDGNRYSEFKYGEFDVDGNQTDPRASDRTEVVYISANDGMLHGFDADTGEELLAYIPNILFSTTPEGEGLHYLTDPNYVHRYYVDIEPSISDVYMKTTPTGTADWHSVLVGGLRGGGRGIYALDVTDPAVFTESNAANIALWEFSNSDDADLGYTYSKPIIAPMNNGRWAAIMGNGYNDTGSGQAQLFIVFLDANLDGSGWTLGSDYIKIPTGVGDSADRNGVASPAVADLDGNGTADRVYAGDLEGNMWAFDLSDTKASNWDVAYSAKSKGKTIPKPLFTAPAGQAITIKPEISKHPTVNDDGKNDPNVMVYFGTGQYLVDTDITDTNTQAFYGVWDHGSDSLTQSELIEQTFDPAFADDSVVTDNYVDYDKATKDKNDDGQGWYLELPDTGERVVVDFNLRGGIVFFNSLVPESNPCLSGGSGFQYALKMENGGMPAAPVTDYNNDGVVDADDMVTDGSDAYTVSREDFEHGLPTKSTFLSNKEYTGGSDGSVAVRDVIPLQGLNTGRLSWQELRR